VIVVCVVCVIVCYDMCACLIGCLWEAYQDKLTKNTWHDKYRCHDVHVLHWLVTQGYKLLMTDMSSPTKGSLLCDQGLPPRERMPLEEACKWFDFIWTGQKTILDLFTECACTNVVLLFPERSEYHLTYLALFLRNLAQLYTAQKHNVLGSDWSLGILFNVHRFPLDRDGNEEIQVGFNLAHGTEVLHQSTWGFIEEVAVLAPPKVGQFSLGWHQAKAITRSSYYAVAKFSGENKNAQDLMEAAEKVLPLELSKLQMLNC
jgi:hypothetical protein